MKKGLIIFLSIALLFFLVIRSFFLHSDRVKKEKLWYVKHLNFEFSARIDSVHVFRKSSGILFFTITEGEINRSVERHLNRKLKYNSNLRCILDRPNGKLAIGSAEAKKYEVGDSIRVVTEQDVIKIYRNGTFVSEAEIAKSLSGRPF